MGITSAVLLFGTIWLALVGCTSAYRHTHRRWSQEREYGGPERFRPGSRPRPREGPPLRRILRRRIAPTGHQPFYPQSMAFPSASPIPQYPQNMYHHPSQPGMGYTLPATQGYTYAHPQGHQFGVNAGYPTGYTPTLPTGHSRSSMMQQQAPVYLQQGESLKFDPKHRMYVQHYTPPQQEDGVTKVSYDEAFYQPLEQQYGGEDDEMMGEMSGYQAGSSHYSVQYI